MQVRKRVGLIEWVWSNYVLGYVLARRVKITDAQVGIVNFAKKAAEKAAVPEFSTADALYCSQLYSVGGPQTLMLDASWEGCVHHTVRCWNIMVASLSASFYAG